MAEGPLIRVGLPQPGGHLVGFARRYGLPVMLSANAFAIRGADKQFLRFRLEAARALRGLDVMLDSAGFVAAVLYGTYDWTVDEYLDLVEALQPRHYSGMDYCCEREIADDAGQRMLRVVETCRLYGELARRAEDRGLPPPVPVIQGWDAADYRRCIELMPIGRWPELVGIGSVCRRHLAGPDGLLTVFDTIDALLPSQARVHLFGVKSSALRLLWHHPRLASSDSMAWDAAMRFAVPRGRTQDLRSSFLLDWLARQQEAGAKVAAGVTRGGSLPEPIRPSATDLLLEAVAESWAELVYENEIDYLSARAYLAHDLCIAQGIAQQEEVGALLEGEFEDVLPGVAERLREMMAV